MATVDGNLVDAISPSEGVGEGSAGRFVTHAGAAALLDASRGKFFLSAKGADGNIYRWIGEEISFAGAPTVIGGYVDAQPSVIGRY